MAEADIEFLNSKAVLQRKITFAEGLTETTLGEIIENIKINTDLKEFTEELRNKQTEKEQQDYKRNTFPYFILATFRNNHRNNDNFISSSFFIYDYDHLDDRLDELKNHFRNDNSVFAFFVSPRGNGLKVIYRLDNQITDHIHFSQIYKYYAAEFKFDLGKDPDKTSDSARACFFSYDPDMFVNLNATPLKTDIELSEPTPDSDTEENDDIPTETKKVKVKKAPKSFVATDNEVSGGTKYPFADNIIKMLANCEQISDLVEKAETSKHLDHPERIIVASLGRFFGTDGKTWIHSVLQNCSDYNKEVTDYHTSTLNHAPILCQSIEEIRKDCSFCRDCKAKPKTPLTLGYTKISQHYHAGSELVRQGKLAELLNKLGLETEEKANFYEVKHDGSVYSINKQRGMWLNQFHIIDFIRFVKPNDWELFIQENYPKLLIDRFAREYTEKTINEIFLFKGEVIEFKNYLSEANAEVERILSDNYNYNVIAFTGSGKTRALIEKIKEKKLKAIFLSPYSSTTEQTGNKFNVPYILGAVTLQSVRESLKTGNIIVSTFDGLSKVLDSQILTEEYILLVDEAHNLVTHSNFRGTALHRISDNVGNFKKIIYITGTPEGVLNNDFKNIKFIKQNQSKLITNYTIIKTSEPSHSAFIEHITGNPPKRGKVIVFMNSVNKLKIMSDALIKTGIKESKIQILNATAKDEELYQSIVKEEIIPSNVKFVLTTSVISDGVNIINQEIDSVYLLDCTDLILLRQFVARFRKGVNNVYDIVFTKAETSPVLKWFDFSVELVRLSKLYENFAEEKNKYFNNIGLIENAGKTNLLKSSTGISNNEWDILRVNEFDGRVFVNYQLLTLDLLKNFNVIAYEDLTKRKEYLDYFLNIDCKYDVIDKVKQDITASKEKVRKEAEEAKAKIIELLATDTKTTVTAYLQNIDTNLLKKIKDKIPELFDSKLSTTDFFNTNKRVLKLKESGQLIKKYLLFTKYSFTHEFILEILKKDNNDINEFELTYYTQLNLYLVKDYIKILKYNKKSLEIFHFALFKFLYDFFKSTQMFTYDGLLNAVNVYLLSQKIAHRRLEKTKLQAILNRIIVKKAHTERVGDKVKRDGYKFVRYKTITDFVDASYEKMISDSFNKFLVSRLDYMNLNLFINSISGKVEKSEVQKDINDILKDLQKLAGGEVKEPSSV